MNKLISILVALLNHSSKFIYSSNMLSWGKRIGLVMTIIVLVVISSFGQTVGDYRTNATGTWSWNTAANWQRCITNGTWAGATSTSYPGQNAGTGTVTILNNTNVNITASVPNAIGALTINSGANNSSVSFSGAYFLTVTGATSITGNTNGVTKSINVGTGTLNVGSISLTSGNGSKVALITVSTGTINCTGNITFGGTATNAQFTFLGAGVLNIGGILGFSGTFTAGSGTVDFNGTVAQTIPVSTYNFNNIQIDNTAGVTLDAIVTATDITGNINVNSGLLSTGNFAVTLANSKGVTVASGATLNAGSTSIKFSGSPAVNISGIFQTANALGFSGASGSAISTTGTPTITLGGASTIEYTVSGGGQTVTGRTYDNLTLDNTSASNSAGGAIVVSRAYSSASGGTLNTTNDINFNGTTFCGGIINASSGTVTYASTAINILKGTYYNLTTNGIASLCDNVNVSGDLIVAGGALSVGAYMATVNGNIAGTGAITSGSGTIAIGGDWTNSGAFTCGTGTVNYNGTASQAIAGLTYNNLTLSGTGTSTFSATATINGTLSVSSSAVANLGAFTTHTANALALGGYGQPSGIFGGAGSGATNINSTYFATASGRITVGASSCTAGTWIGGVSTDWNTAANWCGGVPTSATNVVIPSGGNQPVIGAAGGVCNNITINTGATLSISGSNTLTVSGNFTNNGTFTANSSTVVFNAAGAQSVGSVTYNNLTLSGSGAKTTTGATVNGVLSIEGTAITTGTVATYGAAATLQYKGTAVQTTGTEFPATFTGTGGVIINNTSGVTLGSAKTINYLLNMAAGTLNMASYALTVGSLTGSGNITNSVTARTLTIGSDNTSPAAYSGVISGGATIAVTKTGTGTLILSGTNTYTGVTTINGGVLSVATIGNGGVAGNLGQATNVAANLVLGGGTLQYTGATASTNRAFTLTAGTNSTFDITTNNLTISGASATTNGALTKIGNGTLTLSGANNYSGATTINAGTLMLGNAAALGTSSLTTVTSGAVLDLNGITLSTARPLTINGTGISSGGALINSSGTAVNYNGAITLGSASSIGAGNITLGANGITGGFDLAKSGTGTLNLGSGTVTINGLVNNGLLTSTTGTLNIAADFTNSGTFTHNNGTVNFNGAAPQAVAGGTYYNLTMSGGGAKTLQGATSVAGILSLTSGILNTSATNLLTITNTATGSIGGASAASFVNGPMAWTLLANRTANATYNFPVGDGANYRPLSLVNVTTGTTTPVVLVSETATGALNSDETTVTAVAPRNWYVSVVSGNFTNALIQLTESGLDPTKTIGKSAAQAGNYMSAGGTGIGATITTATTITNAGLPAYFAIGTTVVKTYYSYQSGDWNSANTWTIDPSGSLWIGAAIPTAADNVVILNGRTVTINQDGKSCLSLEIKLGGNLDLKGTGTVTAHNFGTVSGQGTLKLASGVFPGGDFTSFVAAGGGTVQYYNYSGSMASQAVYNNLVISNNTASANNIVLPNPANPSNYTINGDLSIQNTGSGSQTFTIGNVATNVINLTEWGNVNVGNGCNVRVGNVNAIHKIAIYGDFTNNGSVRFTNQASPVQLSYYTAGTTTTGAAEVTFMGGSDNSLICNGVSDFYRFIVDKGTDQTYTLNVVSSNTANFALYAPNNQGGNQFDCGLNCFGTGVYLKALFIKNGTLKLNDNISIPSLTEGGQDFNILPTAALWVNGATVSTTVVGQNGTGYQAATLYGKLRISSGSFSTGDAAGIVLGQSGTPDIIVEGTGTFDVSQVWSSNGSNIMSYTQTGGTTNIRANGESHAGPMLSLTSANCVFNMSGGSLNFINGLFNGTQGIDIQVGLGKYSVTGGTININYPGGVTCDINSTVPFYNFNISRQSGGGTTVARFLNTSSSNISVLNNLTLNANTTLDAGTNTVGLTVGKDFIMDAASTYTPGTNTTTFNGNGGQVFTNAGTITGPGLNNFVLSNASNTNITNPLVIRGYLTINNNCFLNDQGNTIGVAGNITNSGSHTSQGTGGIILNGGGAQIIGSSGTGVFGNFTVNKTAGSSTFSANQLINGNLRLVSGILDINKYNLALSANSNVYDALTGTATPTTFGNTKMITTTGQQSDGGLTKSFNAIGSFLYPVGTGAVYHPGTIAFTQAPATWGDVTVRPVAKAHPFALAGNEVLKYYWKVTSSLITGIQPGSVSHTYKYVAADVTTSDNSYITGLYNPYSWIKGAGAQVDKIGKNILFPSINLLDGEYTAGLTGAFGSVMVYYSRQSGDWGDQNTWSNVSNSGAVATTFPGPDDPVVIGDGGSNNHVVTISSGSKTVGGLQISSGSTLDITTTTGHNFGALPDLKVSGTGTLRISSSAATATFPSGDFGNFLGPNGGTVEYYTQTSPSAIGVAFTLPTTYTSGAVTNIVNYCNLTLSSATGKNITMPNTDLVVYKDFNTNVSGTSATGIARLNTGNATHAVTINGNINLFKGNLQYFNTNAGTTQNLLVNGDLNVSNGATFNVAATNAATSNLTIQGNLANNGTFDMQTGATTPCNVTFTGGTNKGISGSGATTNFNILTVNKGVDRNSILDVTSTAFSLNTAIPTALTLTNGTFRLSSPLTITLTTSSAFTIPTSGCLSANNGIINIGAANNNAADLMLQGRLEVLNTGIVNIGNGGGSNNDIEYASAGNPEINVSGGSLNVDGQIRRNLSNTLGSLWFNQSGGTITVKGNNFDATRGMFEVTNTGSQFNVSGGNLVIQRAGSSSYADVLITPESSNVTGIFGVGHTLTIGNGNTPATQVFDLDISAPVWNLTVDGTTNSKTAGLSVNTLSIKNNLTINGSSVFNANELDVTIGGSLTNNNPSATQGVDQGGYQSGAAGSTQNTTFTGTSTGAGSISGTGSNLTNFANLVIGLPSTMPAITLGANSDLRVDNNLTLTSGILDDAGNTISVYGNIANSATHTSPLIPGGGIVLSSGSKQVLSGNGSGSYGNVTINNASGVDMTCNNLIKGQLALLGGLLYIDDYKLTMDVNASFSGSFDPKHMVELNGVLSDAGVQKLFSGTTTNFVFPIGSNGKYRPATYSLTSSDAGSIKVVPVALAHPVDNIPTTDQLNYYWKITTTGFSGLTAATQVYQYGTSEVSGNESNYHGALYNNFLWSDYGASVINTSAHTITINRSDLLAGEYTAGEVANFSNKPPLYSVGNGNWSNGNNWSINPSGIPAYGSAPNGNPVFIQAGHVITMDINNAYAYSVNIVGTLDMGQTSFHNLGYIIDTLHVGTGRLRLQATSDGMFLFPGGNYDRYMASPGTTVELYDVGSQNATMPLKPGNIYKPYQNLDLTGNGIKYMSAENLKILGNLTINDGAKLNNTLFNKTLYILGNWTDKNAAPGGFVPGTGLTSFEGSLAQTLRVTNAVTENYYDFRVNNAAGLTLAGGGNVQISDLLYLNSGAITTNSTNSLTLSSAGTSAVVGGSLGSFINGPLRKQINSGSFFNFPVGVSGTPSRYGSIYLSNIVNAGIWEAQYYNNDPTVNTPSLDITKKKLPISHVSANEYWRVNGVAGGSGNVQLRWDANSGYAASTTSTRSKIRVVEWNPSGTPSAQWEYRGKILNDGGDVSGTVTTDNSISLAPGTDLHYLTIGDEGLPTATITSSLTASVCNDATTSTTVKVALTGTPPWSLTYKLGSVSTTLNNIASSPVSIVLTSASPGITQPIASNTVFNFNITNVNDLTGTPGITDYVTTVALTVKPIPSNTITGKTSVGTGELVTYSTPADASSYTWALSSNGTAPAWNAATCDITWGGLTPGPYTLSLTKTGANSCVATNSIFVTTSTTPTPLITGSQYVCANSTGNIYSTPNVSGHDYTWTISPAGAGTITAGSNTNSITVTWNGAATGNSVNVKEHVTASGSPGTYTNATYLVDIGMQPSASVPSITSPASVCNGSSVPITISNSENNVRYQLRLNSDNSASGSPVDGSGGSILLTGATITSNTVYNVKAYTLSPFNCSAQLTNPGSTFTVNALAALDYGTVASGDQTICNSSTPNNISFLAAPSGGAGTYNYQWYSYNGLAGTCPSGTAVPSGWSLISGATSNNYSPPSLTTSMSYAVMVTPTGTPTCGTATWAGGCRQITVNASATAGVIGTSQSICNGSTPAALTSTTNGTGSGTITYEWQADAGSGYSTIGGAVSSTYTPGALTVTTSYQRRTKTVSGGVTCYSGYTTPVTITVNPLPSITLAATAADVCHSVSAQNSTLTYSAVTNAPTNYTITWNAAALTAGLVNPGSTTLPASPITVPVAGNVATGTYTGTLVVTNGNGCAATGVTFTLKINPLPVTGPAYRLPNN
ncbi:MAG: autotransporter-associated beta strand repeat-containing protein [Bacteroidota bacterium]|nr:autotransporter-associated beta strand repeat-containing protein [Bacteroidota bacterium]